VFTAKRQFIKKIAFINQQGGVATIVVSISAGLILANDARDEVYTGIGKIKKHKQKRDGL
jgi:hypothetical protein